MRRLFVDRVKQEREEDRGEVRAFLRKLENWGEIKKKRIQNHFFSAKILKTKKSLISEKKIKFFLRSDLTDL